MLDALQCCMPSVRIRHSGPLPLAERVRAHEVDVCLVRCIVVVLRHRRGVITDVVVRYGSVRSAHHLFGEFGNLCIEAELTRAPDHMARASSSWTDPGGGPSGRGELDIDMVVVPPFTRTGCLYTVWVESQEIPKNKKPMVAFQGALRAERYG